MKVSAQQCRTGTKEASVAEGGYYFHRPTPTPPTKKKKEGFLKRSPRTKLKLSRQYFPSQTQSKHSLELRLAEDWGPSPSRAESEAKGTECEGSGLRRMSVRMRSVVYPGRVEETTQSLLSSVLKASPSLTSFDSRPGRSQVRFVLQRYGYKGDSHYPRAGSQEPPLKIHLPTSLSPHNQLRAAGKP